MPAAVPFSFQYADGLACNPVEGKGGTLPCPAIRSEFPVLSGPESFINMEARFEFPLLHSCVALFVKNVLGTFAADAGIIALNPQRS